MPPLLLLTLAILAIILLSSWYKLNTFVVLLGLAVLVGLLAGIPGETVLTHIRTGFGHTLEKVGLLIVLGTMLGSLLDRTHATTDLANFILRTVGESAGRADRTPLAVTLIGFLIGLPIFCDSGFIVLSGLVLTLAQRLGRYHLRLMLNLAGSLYAVHCLVPPHPGITAAVGILNPDSGQDSLGQMMLLGTLLAVPGTLVSYLWARYVDRGDQTTAPRLPVDQANESAPQQRGASVPVGAFCAVLVPIALIAAKPLFLLAPDRVPPLLLTLIRFVGDPVMALAIGMLIALTLFRRIDKATVNAVLDDAIHKAGPVLAIVAGGGAFGEIIKHIGLESTITNWATATGGTAGHIPLWLPFLLALVFKTAQGSSTVAIMSVSAIVLPLLPALGVQTDFDRLLVLGAMGAGSMSVSHANDAYFWVVSRFGQIDTPTMVRSYSLMTLLMGLATFATLWLISLFTAGL
ncbi:putative permease [Fibrella aestuarina BUZ 2]|uniref:Putative permease n=1 Tax=Fibrella aestuarina BUZ 2 TaxID=1166018 RepID=I0KCD6_9BACT|nr:GntP family permease [Fibrella aestuarina]CCH01789.1 putative permease [Fibrella aestuarina BUZ 2]